MHVPVRLAPQVPARVVVLASGAGSLFASMVRSTVDPAHPVDVVALGTDRACAAVDVAAELGVVGFTVRVGAHPDRAAWDRALTEAVDAHRPQSLGGDAGRQRNSGVTPQVHRNSTLR